MKTRMYDGMMREKEEDHEDKEANNLMLMKIKKMMRK